MHADENSQASTTQIAEDDHWQTIPKGSHMISLHASTQSMLDRCGPRLTVPLLKELLCQPVCPLFVHLSRRRQVCDVSHLQCHLRCTATSLRETCGQHAADISSCRSCQTAKFSCTVCLQFCMKECIWLQFCKSFCLATLHPTTGRQD